MTARGNKHRQTTRSVTESSARTTILQAVRSALLQTTMPSPAKRNGDWEPGAKTQSLHSLNDRCRRFAAELTAVNGEAIEVADSAELVKSVTRILYEEDVNTLVISGGKALEEAAQLLAAAGVRIVRPLGSAEERKQLLAEIKVSLVEASCGVADTGTVVLSPKLPSQWAAILPEVLIVILKKAQLLRDHFELVQKAEDNEYAGGVWMTGPSRTADIEKILILGAHGPRRLIILLAD